MPLCFQQAWCHGPGDLSALLRKLRRWVQDPGTQPDSQPPRRPTLNPSTVHPLCLHPGTHLN